MSESAIDLFSRTDAEYTSTIRCRCGASFTWECVDERLTPFVAKHAACYSGGSVSGRPPASKAEDAGSISAPPATACTCQVNEGGGVRVVGLVACPVHFPDESAAVSGDDPVLRREWLGGEWVRPEISSPFKFDDAPPIPAPPDPLVARLLRATGDYDKLFRAGPPDREKVSAVGGHVIASTAHLSSVLAALRAAIDRGGESEGGPTRHDISEVIDALTAADGGR